MFKDVFLFISVLPNGQSRRVYYIYRRERTSNGVGDKNSSTLVLTACLVAFKISHFLLFIMSLAYVLSVTKAAIFGGCILFR